MQRITSPRNGPRSVAVHGSIVQSFQTMEPRHEIIQLGIAALPPLLAVLVMIWSPSTQARLRLKGICGAALFFLPFWLMRINGGSCISLQQICAPGEVSVWVNPAYYGGGLQSCTECASNISSLFITLNSWRPTLLIETWYCINQYA